MVLASRVLQSFCTTGRYTSTLSLHLTPAVVPLPILAFPTKTRPTRVDKYRTSQSSSRLDLVARHLSSNPAESANMSTGYRVRKVYAPNTLQHRVYITDENHNAVSPFHDIPLYADDSHQYLNMVVEIPRWTNGKLEVRLTGFSTILGVAVANLYIDFERGAIESYQAGRQEGQASLCA